MQYQKHQPRIYSASVRGNTHVLREIANQDSSCFRYGSSSDRWAAAIADGHGSSAHRYSEVGAKIAAQCAVDIALLFQEENLNFGLSLEDIGEQIVASIIDSWRLQIQALEKKQSSQHVNIEEDEALRKVDYILYGTTLAFVFPYRDVLLLGSIGDSDGFLRSHSGLVRSLDLFGINDDGIGEETHSLCLPNAKRFFKFKALPSIDGGSMFLATDGVKKSLRDDTSLNSLLDYYHGLASENKEFLERDLTEQLQALTSEGSGDDCTALIIHFPLSEKFETIQAQKPDLLTDDPTFSLTDLPQVIDLRETSDSADLQHTEQGLLVKKKPFPLILLVVLTLGILIATVTILFPMIPTRHLAPSWMATKNSTYKIFQRVSKKAQCLSL